MYLRVGFDRLMLGLRLNSMVSAEGLEPPTPRFVVGRANPLSYAEITSPFTVEPLAKPKLRSCAVVGDLVVLCSVRSYLVAALA